MITGHAELDALLVSISFFNSFLMLWLGATVCFNAWKGGRLGFWAAGGNLLLGGAFFLVHSAILGLGFHLFSPRLEILWRLGWLAVAALPYSWYVVVLWYSGFWEDRRAPLAQRHRGYFLLMTAFAGLWCILILVPGPLPSLLQILHGEMTGWPSVAGRPLTLLIYPLYILLCIGLSFDALQRPGPTRRLMGDLARRRAQPWLLAVTVALLVVCILVGAAVVWVLSLIQTEGYSDTFLTVFGWLDLLVSALIGLATILLGQAVVSYEIFTGRILPRRGLARLWRSALMIAAGYGALAGVSLAVPLLPVYPLLLAAALIAFVYALAGWRSYTEREEFASMLRPLVSSQQLYDRLTRPGEALPDRAMDEPFRTLCRDMLATSRAALAAIGPMAPLWGTVLTYPEEFPLKLPPADWNRAGNPLAVSIDPAEYAGMRWVIPLWSQRGPIGLLLLADKRDGSLFTQEDLETARTICERLIDTHASAELARRLFALQRDRLVSSQVLDRKLRRVLHDEVLPSLHAILLSLNRNSDTPDAAANAQKRLAALHREISSLLREIPPAAPLNRARASFLDSLRQVAQEELRDCFESTAWDADPYAESLLQRLPDVAADVLFFAAREAMRNAARHARGGDEARSLDLAVRLTLVEETLRIEISDDGVGLARSGSRQPPSGQGLALHSTLLAVVGGELTIDSRPEGTSVRLSIPISSTGLPAAPEKDAP